MRKLSFSLIIIMSGILGMQAQDEGRIILINSIFGEENFQLLNLLPGNFLYYPAEDFSRSALYSNYQAGKYKQGAAPETALNFGVNTRGKYTNEKGQVFFGNFNISKSYYQNLAWNLSHELPNRGLMADPHYFAVSKPAPWDNQKYNLSGGILSSLISDKIHWFLKADYNLENKYRTDFDPRPRITVNELDLSAGFNFKINKAHNLKLSGAYHFSEVSNDITFANNNKNQPVNYDIYVRWIAGYGSITGAMQNSYKKNITGLKFHTGYAFNTPKTKILADLVYKKHKNITLRNNNVLDESDITNHFARHYPEQLNLLVQVNHFISDSKVIGVVMKSTLNRAKNFWQDKSGKTYSSNSEDISLNVNYISQKYNENDFELGARISLWKIKQRDALANTLSQYQNSEIGLVSKKNIIMGDNFQISPFLNLNVRIPLNSNLINGNATYLDNISENDFAGLTLKSFYQDVVYPDFEMWSTPAINFKFGSALRVFSSEKIQSFFNFEGGATKPLEKLENFDASSPYRWHGQVSLSVYY